MPAEEYTGTYRFVPFVEIQVTSEGSALFAQVTGFPKAQLERAENGEYFFKEVDAQITFVRNGQDQVHSLLLRRNGTQFPPARRVGVTK
ncbi:DUF3471 domain-containing protein [Candidatus Cyanaurora vandensis]|nr:DUF3471 domain-containing protein [Candidatus Cyanaurora vandensis]